MIALLLALLPYFVTPDPAKTPGAVRTATLAEICTKGSSKRVRDVPKSRKDSVYEEYGILHREPGEYEIDHDVSLELGGSNDIRNLWPERYELNVDGYQLGAHEKDKLENKLHWMVCHSQLTLKRAQSEIRGDWTIAYRKYVSPSFPRVSSRRGDSSLGIHAPLETSVQRDRADRASRVSRPICHTFGLAERRDHDQVASMPAILGSADPAAVVRTIPAIIVTAVDGEICAVAVSQRPISERGEVVLPCAADRNPAAAIATIPIISRIQADHLHPSPNVVEATSEPVLTKVFPLTCVIGALPRAVLVTRAKSHTQKYSLEEFA